MVESLLEHHKAILVVWLAMICCYYAFSRHCLHN